MDHFDEADAFVSGNQVSCLTLNILALQQNFDDVRARGRGTETVVLHGVGQFFFVKSLARCFHGGQEGGFGKALGRAGFLLLTDCVEDILRLTIRQI